MDHHKLRNSYTFLESSPVKAHASPPESDQVASLQLKLQPFYKIIPDHYIVLYTKNPTTLWQAEHLHRSAGSSRASNSGLCAFGVDCEERPEGHIWIRFGYKATTYGMV